jgi:hypothetical protein
MLFSNCLSDRQAKAAAMSAATHHGQEQALYQVFRHGWPVIFEIDPQNQAMPLLVNGVLAQYPRFHTNTGIGRLTFTQGLQGIPPQVQ